MCDNYPEGPQTHVPFIYPQNGYRYLTSFQITYFPAAAAAGSRLPSGRALVELGLSGTRFFLHRTDGCTKTPIYVNHEAFWRERSTGTWTIPDRSNLLHIYFKDNRWTIGYGAPLSIGVNPGCSFGPILYQSEEGCSELGNCTSWELVDEGVDATGDYADLLRDNYPSPNFNIINPTYSDRADSDSRGYRSDLIGLNPSRTNLECAAPYKRSNNVLASRTRSPYNTCRQDDGSAQTIFSGCELDYSHFNGCEIGKYYDSDLEACISCSPVLYNSNSVDHVENGNGNENVQLICTGPNDSILVGGEETGGEGVIFCSQPGFYYDGPEKWPYEEGVTLATERRYGRCSPCQGTHGCSQYETTAATCIRSIGSEAAPRKGLPNRHSCSAAREGYFIRPDSDGDRPFVERCPVGEFDQYGNDLEPNRDGNGGSSRRCTEAKNLNPSSINPTSSFCNIKCSPGFVADNLVDFPNSSTTLECRSDNDNPYLDSDNEPFDLQPTFWRQANGQVENHKLNSETLCRAAAASRGLEMWPASGDATSAYPEGCSIPYGEKAHFNPRDTDVLCGGGAARADCLYGLNVPSIWHKRPQMAVRQDGEALSCVARADCADLECGAGMTNHGNGGLCKGNVCTIADDKDTCCSCVADNEPTYEYERISVVSEERQGEAGEDVEGYGDGYYTGNNTQQLCLAAGECMGMLAGAPPPRPSSRGPRRRRGCSSSTTP